MSDSSTELVLDGIRSPVDRVAARVIGKGFEYASAATPNVHDQRSPYELRNPLSISFPHRGLIGAKFGRMTVKGMSFETNKASALWSVRCACGMYTLRTAKAIRNPANNKDCCSACRHLLYLKRHEAYLRTGRNVDRGDL